MAKAKKSTPRKKPTPLPDPTPDAPPPEPPGRPRRGIPTPEEMDPDRPLDDDERRFVDEYMVDRKRTRAYLRAFPTCGDYRTAVRFSGYLLARPAVRTEISRAVAAQRERTGIRADRVLQEITNIAFSDIWDLFDPDTGRLRHVRQIPLEARRAVSSITIARERRTVRTDGTSRTTTTEQIVTVRFWDKLAALGKLTEYLGLKTSIPPLEALLQALPRELAVAVRAMLTAPSDTESMPSRTVPALSDRPTPK